MFTRLLLVNRFVVYNSISTQISLIGLCVYIVGSLSLSFSFSLSLSLYIYIYKMYDYSVGLVVRVWVCVMRAADAEKAALRMSI